MDRIIPPEQPSGSRRGHRTYHGRRTPGGEFVVVVEIDFVAGAGRRRTRPLRHVVSHSPSGFNWGYAGSGPADLALSILADALGEGDPKHGRAWALHQGYKRDVVAALGGDEWRIERADVLDWVRRRAAALAPAEEVRGGEV